MQRNRVKKTAFLQPPCYQKANADFLLEQNGFLQLDPMFVKSQILAQIGNFIFDFASGQVEWTPARETIALADLVTAIQHILKEDIASKQVHIETDFTEVASLETVKSDLHNILLSLIGNAISQQDKDKHLEIKIKTTRLASRNCLTIQDNSLHLKCREIDTFVSFPQSRAKAAENGLRFQVISTQIAVLGGKAEMASRPGAGTTFKLYLML